MASATPIISALGHTSAELINSEILATCSALGSFEDDVYHKDNDCIECLKDLIKFLRTDNEFHAVRRQLGALNVLQTDLLPIICHYHNEDLLFDVSLRLIVNLTNPALLLYQEELPDDKVTRNYYLELVSALQKYKRAFADSKIWEVLTNKLKGLLEKEPGNHDEDDKLIMERILILIRNVVNIASSPEDDLRTDDDVCLHDQVLWAINVSGMADLLIFIAANEDEQQFCFHVMEIIFQIFREQTPSQLAAAGDSRSASEKQKDANELAQIRARENAASSKSAKNFSRFPRFGVTYQLKNFTSISDRDLICHKFPTEIDKVDLNSSKPKRNTPKNRRPMEDFEHNRRSTLSVRRFLKNFCIDFLDSAYNAFMGVLKDHLTRGRAQNHDETYYLWAVNYFMEFNRLHKFDVSRISETLSVPMFYYIHTQMEHNYEMMVAEKSNKKKLSQWAKRMNLGLKAYHEILMTLATMDVHPDRDIQESAKVMKGNIFYTSEYRDLLHHLVVVYDPVKFPKSYLKDLIETVHIFVRMLEQYCKAHKHVIVQKKDKKRKKRSHKAKETSSPEEQLQKLWDEIADDVSHFLPNKDSITDISPFDPTLDITEDEQKKQALIKIQSALREKRVGESVTLLRASRELWPEGDLFGKSGLLPEEEFLSLREIFFTTFDGAPVFPPKEVEIEDDSDSSEDEMSAVRVSEQEFNFFEFIKRFSSPKVVQPYAYLLANYQKNSDFTNKAILKMMHRIAWDMKMYGLFFQASLFRTFQKILDDPTRNTNSSIKELARFSKFIVAKFFEVSAKNKKAFMEILFWKNSREVYEIQEGYGTFEKEGGANKNTWSEEQDEELKQLYEDYQKLGETDQDVIDYIAEKLIDSSKTHRQILRQLKYLDIVKPKAPRAPKEWSEEEISQLRSLFDQYKSSTDILSRILENLTVVRSKVRVVDKLLELGLVADRKELRKKRSKKSSEDKRATDPKAKKSKKKQQRKTREGFEGLEGLVASDSESGASSGEESNDDELSSSSAKKRTQDVAPLDQPRLKEILEGVLEADLKIALIWIRLSMETTVEDLEEEDGEAESVPLVPIVDAHYKAMENNVFQSLLKAIGFCQPDNHQERFWRIPSHLSVYQLKSRIQVIEKAERGQLFLDINTETNDQAGESFSKRMTSGKPVTDNQSDSVEPYVSGNTSNKRKKTQINSDSEDDMDNEKLIIDEGPTTIEAPKTKRKKIIVVDSSDSEQENEMEVAMETENPFFERTKRGSNIIISSDSEAEEMCPRSTPSVGENMISRGIDQSPGVCDVNDDKDAFTVTSEKEGRPDDVSVISLGLERKRKEPGSRRPSDTTIDVHSVSDDQPSVRRPRKIQLIESDDDE